MIIREKHLRKTSLSESNDLAEKSLYIFVKNAKNKCVAIDTGARIFRRFSVSRRTLIGGFCIHNPTT